MLSIVKIVVSPVHDSISNVYVSLGHYGSQRCLPYFNDFSSLSVKFLEILKPFISVLPEVSKPERKVNIIYSFVFISRCLVVSFDSSVIQSNFLDRCQKVNLSIPDLMS